jgi:hypothetical protein
MKLSLRLRPRRTLTRSEAWGCFTANLALPGAGSLAAGRAVGYWQMAVALMGVAVTLLTTVSMFHWAMSRGGGSPASMDDPIENLLDLWQHVRWPLAGIGMFAVALLWAMATSRAILASVPKDTAPPPIPPLL